MYGILDFQKVRKTLQMKPLLLWGIRLLAGLLVWLAAIGFGLFPLWHLP